MKVLSVLRPGRVTSDIDSIGAMSLPINVGTCLRDMGVTTHYMTDAILEDTITYNFENLKGLKSIVEHAFSLYRSNGYDVLHFNLFNFSYVPHILNNIEGRDRVVATLHLPPVGLSAYTVSDDLRELSTRPNIKIVAVSDTGVRDILKNNNTESITIHNGVKDYPELYKPLSKKIDRGVIIGRMETSKNILEGLTYFVTRQIPVVYIGTTPQSQKSLEYSDACRKYIEEHRDLIDHREKLSNREVREVLSDSLFNLSLSTLESFGLSLVESNVVGTPNIYLEIPGVQDTQVDELTGYRIDPKRAYRARWEKKYTLIDESLDRIRKSKDDLSENMRDYIIKNFSLEKCAQEYKTIYEEVAKWH